MNPTIHRTRNGEPPEYSCTFLGIRRTTLSSRGDLVAAWAGVLGWRLGVIVLARQGQSCGTNRRTVWYNCQMAEENSRERAERLMPEVDDTTLVVLKGHLLIEEQLQSILDALAHDRGALASARLTFAQRFQLVQALTGELMPEVVRFVRGLNTLRNQLVHRLEHPDVVAMLNDLLFGTQQADSSVSEQQRLALLRMNIGIAIGVFSGRASRVHPASVDPACR